MKACLFLLFFIALFQLNSSGFSNDTGELKGMVSDQKSGEPLIGAIVQLVEAGKVSITNSQGNYGFSEIPAGVYTLKVSYVGYLNLVLPGVSIIKGKTMVREIELEADVKTLNELNVQVFRFENNKTRLISTHSFSRDEISLNPGSQGDIFRAIGMLPGVSSSGGIYSAIAVRGQGVRDNVYLVDDIPLTEVGHLEGNSFFNDPNGGRFSIFAPRVIDQAIFQGAAFGAEYGRRSASFLGLNIKEGSKGSAVFDGQLDLLGLNMNYDGPSGLFKNTTLFVSGRYQNFYPLVHLIGLKNLGLPSYGDFIFKSTTDINKNNKLNVLLMICPERFYRNMENVYADKPLNLLYLPDFKRNKIVSGINLRTLVGKQAVWKNVLYFTQYTSDVNVGKAYPVFDMNAKLSSTEIPFISSIQTQNYSENKWGIRSILDISFSGKDKLIAGIESDITELNNNRRLLVNDTSFVFRRNESVYPNLNFQVISPEMVNSIALKTAANASLFANYYFDLHKKLSAQTGFRIDYNGFTNQFVVAPRGNISYHFNTNHSLSAGSGIYYQDPVLSDIADLPATNSIAMEKVIHYILSYRAYFKGDLKLMLEFWGKTFENMVQSPVSGSVFRNNNGTGRGYGADLSLTKRLSGKWHGMFSYSFMNMLRNNNDGLGDYPFSFSQPHQLNLMLSYKWTSKISVSGKYRFASGRPTDTYIIHKNVLNNADNVKYGMELIGRNESRLPYFSSLDLRINYNFRYKNSLLIAFFDVVNVLNRQIANSENFNYLSGKTYYDGLAIFPTGGLKFEF